MDYSVDSEGFEVFVEEQKTKIKDEILGQYKAIRKERKMTQQKVADLTGIKRTNVVRIESGRYVPTIAVLVKLAAALDMELEVKLVDKK